MQERLDKVQKATLPSEAEQAVKEAENKAKEADNFLKEASEDGQITEDELETARKNNEEIEGLKEKAQAEIDKLPENVREDLQDRLNKVEAPVLPPVTPSTKVGVANNTIEQSPLDDNRKGTYYEKVKGAGSDNEIDEILEALAAEIAVKRAEDKAKEAADLVEKAKNKGSEVTESEKDAIDSANNGVDYYKEQAQPKVTNLPDSVEDIKKELQERLDKVQKATLPSDGGDTTPDQDGAGSSDTGSDEGTNPPTNGAGEGDAGSGQGTGDQTPGQGGGDSTEDNSTDNGDSESSDDQSDEPDENSELKDKQKAAAEALDNLSHLDDNQREQYKKDIAEAQDEGTVEYIVDKAQLENIKKLNTASKKDKEADGRKEVTVEEQEEAKRNIEEIKNKLNDPNNNLTQEQKEELEKLLGEIEVPRTQYLLNKVDGDAVAKQVSDLTGKAAHVRVGIDAEGKSYGTGTAHGNVLKDSMKFGSGDDILEVKNGIGNNGKVNLGAGNDELIVHGTAYASTNNVGRRAAPRASIDGGEGTDTIILKGNSEQNLHGEYISNFDRVELNGTNGHFKIKLSEMKDQKLGGNKPLIVSGVAGQGNTVDFDYGTGKKSENKPGQSIGKWIAQPKTQTKDGKTYVVWRHADSLATSEHDVWVENTLGVRG